MFKTQSRKLPVMLLVLTAYCLLLTVSNAHAMHISEGILPFNWAALWSIIAVPFVAYGLYRLRKLSAVDLSFKPLVGLMAAVVFIISCMPIPVPNAGTCSHPCGTAISANSCRPCDQCTGCSSRSTHPGTFPRPWRSEYMGSKYLLHGCHGFLRRLSDLQSATLNENKHGRLRIRGRPPGRLGHLLHNID